MRFSLKSGLTLGLAALFLCPALAAQAQEFPYILQMKDSQGNIQSVICRPATPDEQARLPQSSTHTLATPKPATAAKPAPKPAAAESRAPSYRIIPNYPVPGAPAPSTLPVQPAQPATMQATLPASPQVGTQTAPVTAAQPATAAGSHRLYADPSDIEAAFRYYVLRKHAYAPRGVQGPDPALHAALPPLKTGSPAPSRGAAPSRSSVSPPAAAAKPAPAQPAVAAVPADHGPLGGEASRTQTATDSNTAQPQAAPAQPQTVSTQPGFPSAPSASNGTETKQPPNGGTSRPAMTGSPGQPQAAAPVPAIQGGTPGFSTSGAGNPLLSPAPVMPEPTPIPRNLTVQ